MKIKVTMNAIGLIMVIVWFGFVWLSAVDALDRIFGVL